MGFDIAACKGDGYLVLKYKGTVTSLADEEQLATQCLEEFKKYDYSRMLIDFRAMEFLSSITDQCQVVSHYNAEFPNWVRTVRVALVVTPEAKELHEFWELYAGNRGYPWRVFTDIGDAISYITD